MLCFLLIGFVLAVASCYSENDKVNDKKSLRLRLTLPTIDGFCHYIIKGLITHYQHLHYQGKLALAVTLSQTLSVFFIYCFIKDKVTLYL